MKMLLLMILVVRYIFISLVFFSCYHKQSIIYSIYGKTQGTFYNVKYFSQEKIVTKNHIDSILLVLDNSLSSYKDSSFISNINNNISNELDSFLQEVINRSLEICHESKGAFDITVAPIVNSYGFGPDKNQKIDSLELFKSIGCDKITIKNGVIDKVEENIKLDVNGIAQGFSVDVLVAYLKQKGITDFLINIGGEVFCSGQKNKKPWLVAIEKPIPDIQSQKYIVQLSNKALATSGSYRKFRKEKNKIISHTINPKTLKPAENNLISVSIMASTCMDADAYATVCMSMGLKNAKNFVQEKNIEACFIYREDNDTLTFITNGLLDLISPYSSDFSDLQPSLDVAPQ